MSRRLNLYGFSLGQMRRLFRSGDERAVRRIHDRLAAEGPHWSVEEVRQVSEIVERAIMIGIPFAGLGVETYLHTRAARALASDEQPPTDEPYAAISREKLQSFRVGLADFREQITYRVGRKRDPTEEDREASVFVNEFCGWVDPIREAGRDLWFVYG